MQGVQRSKIEAMKAEGKEEAFFIDFGFCLPKMPLKLALSMSSQYVASTPPCL